MTVTRNDGLLVMDVGNTHVAMGFFLGEKLEGSWRMASSLHRTADEYTIIVKAFLREAGMQTSDVHAVAVANVVPPLTPRIESFIQKAFGLTGFFVSPGIKSGMPILYDNPQEVGADRIVNAVATIEYYKTPAIVVDFGTATTFDVITGKGEYAGGVIAPGLQLSADSLFQRAARLPRVEVSAPLKIVATNTVESIKAGLYHGYAGLVEGILKNIREERNEDSFVLATGGLASAIIPALPSVDKIDDVLTLKGLRILYDRNR